MSTIASGFLHGGLCREPTTVGPQNQWTDASFKSLHQTRGILLQSGWCCVLHFLCKSQKFFGNGEWWSFSNPKLQLKANQTSGFAHIEFHVSRDHPSELGALPTTTSNRYPARFVPNLFTIPYRVTEFCVLVCTKNVVTECLGPTRSGPTCCVEIMARLARYQETIRSVWRCPEKAQAEPQPSSLGLHNVCPTSPNLFRQDFSHGLDQWVHCIQSDSNQKGCSEGCKFPVFFWCMKLNKLQYMLHVHVPNP